MPGGSCQPGTTMQCADAACTATCNPTGVYDACVCPGAVGTGGGGAGGSSVPVAGTGSGGTSAPVAGAGGGGGAQGGSGGSTMMPNEDDPNAWRMMGFDDKNWYFNPHETTLSPSNAGSLVEKWRFTVAGFPPGSPVIAEGKVFVMASGGTYAIDLATGAEVWKRMDLTGTASVAYEDGFVYVHTSAGAALHKLDAANGTSVWGPIRSYDLTACDGTSSPIVADGKVIVGHSCGALEVGAPAAAAAARGGVEAHSTADGAKAWSYFTVPATGENGAMVWSSVAIDVAGGTVFASTGNNYTVSGGNSDAIHAIDLATGVKSWAMQVRAGDLWQYQAAPLGPDTDFGANPILAEVGGTQIVAAGDKGSAFWALDRATGEILWQRDNLSSNHTPANGGVLMNGAFDGTYFYVVSNQPPNASVLHALDPTQEGADAWTPKTYAKTAWGAPSLANGVLVVPIDDDLYVLEASTGNMLTMFNTGGTIAAGAAAIAQGRIVVQSGLQYPFDGSVKNNNQIICYGLP